MKKIIYQLVVDDVQTVAEQEIGRLLSGDEIKQLEDSIAKNINWYDAIANAISEKLDIQE